MTVLILNKNPDKIRKRRFIGGFVCRMRATVTLCDPWMCGTAAFN